MQISVILPLVSAIFVFCLGFFVLLKNAKSKLNILFVLTSLSMTLWLFGTFMMFDSTEDVLAIFWDRFIYIGVVFIPTFMYHFSIIFSKIKKQKILLFLSYVLSSIFLILSRTDYFISGLFKYTWGVHGEAKFFHHIFLVFFFFYLFLFFFNIFRCYRNTSMAIVKNQAKYIFVAFFIFTFASLGYLPAYKIAIYPITYIFGVIFTMIWAYAIVKYRLMDIRLIIRRSIFYFLLTFYVAGLYAFLTFVAGSYLAKLGVSSAFIPLIVAFIVVIGLEPLKKILAKYTDKIFYKGRINYQEVLRGLSEIVAKEIKLEDLLDSVLITLVKGFKIKSAQVLVADDRGKFLKPDSYLNGRSRIVLSDKSHLIKYLNKNKDIIITEELSRMAEDVENAREKKDFQEVEKELESLGCGLCSPVMIENKLTAVIVIGTKLSGDMFSKEDIRLFEVITPQMAAALEKAKLYEEVQDFSKTLQAKVEQRTKQLKKANFRLQKLDKAKSEFLSIAAHQLRTPLTGIKGYLSMLLEGDFGHISDPQNKIIKGVFESSERLNRLVNVFLNISRIESGQLKLEKALVILEDLVAKIIDNFQLEAKKKNIVLRFIKPKNKTKNLNIDKDKITDVINNLIDNSLKYTNHGKVTVTIKQDKNQTIFSVQDTGVGMSEDDLSDMFNKFSRTSASERMNTGGSGLGLYIAKRLIESHGGKIWAKSKGTGKGSEFSFSLPMA